MTAMQGKITVMLMALVVLLVSYLYNIFSRRSGVWFMVAVGTVVALFLVFANIIADADHKTILPVLIGSAAFLYLWWLSVLVFDLSFIWHRYIRNALALHRMQDCFNHRYKQPIVSRSIGATEKIVASGIAQGATMVRNSVELAKKIMPARK